MRQNEAEFDEKFEHALSTYADLADAGHDRLLAARVLAAIEAKQRKRPWLYGWTIAASAMVCLLLAFLLVLHPRRAGQAAHVSPSPVVIPLSPSASPATQTLSLHKHSNYVRAAISHREHDKLPKLDEFPSPAPLTDQEYLLKDFAAHADTETQRSMAKTQEQLDEPLGITELDIPSLDSQIEPDTKR